MTKIQWTLNAGEDLLYWKKQDIKKYERIKLLIKNIQETPFIGIGKPEPLRYSLSGMWSRRINHEHRLIYSVSSDQIIIHGCRFHYN